MSKEKIYIEGLRTFKPNANAPDFVIGDGVLEIGTLNEFIKQNANLLTEYNGKKQLRFQILRSRDWGAYFVVNNYKKEEANAASKKHVTIEAEDKDPDDLPF